MRGIAVRQPETRESLRPRRLRIARPSRREVAVTILLCLAFCLGAFLGLILHFPRSLVYFIWPPSVVMFVALVLAPRRLWPLLMVAVFPVHLLVEWWTVAAPPLSLALFYAVVCVQAIVGAACVERFERRPLRLDNTRALLVLLASGALAAAIVEAATLDFVLVLTTPDINVSLNFLQTFLADALTMVVLAPALVLGGTAARRHGWLDMPPHRLRTALASARGMLAGRLRPPRTERVVEAGLLTFGLLAVAIVALAGYYPTPGALPAVLYTLLPLLLWAALRFGLGGTSLALCGLTLLAILFAMHGRGPFSTQSATENLLSLQLFLIAVALPVLVLAVIVQERQRAEQEREAARKEAERQAEQLDRIIEAIADAVVVYDAGRRTLRVNAAARLLVGVDAAPLGYNALSADERLAQYETRDELGHVLEPGTSPMVRALGGEVLTGSNAMDVHLRTFDGRELDISASAAPLRDPNGQIIGAVGVYRDQTERNRLERSVSEQARQLEATFAAITDAVFMYDREGNIQRLNPAAHALLAGSVPSDYATLPPHERAASMAMYDAQGVLLPDEQRPVMRLVRGEVLSGPQTQEVLLRLADGRELAASIAGAPIRDAQGTIIGAVKVLRDETERKRLERERQEARTNELAAREIAQQLDRFFAMASHDIRSPTTAAGGFVQLAHARAQLLADHLPADDEQATTLLSGLLASLESADQSGVRLQRLVSRLFDTAQAGAGKLTLSMACVDLVPLVQDHVAAQQIVLPGRRIALDAPSGPVWVEADTDRLGQVLTNYLTNALKYSPDVQPVSVRLVVRDGHAVVSVHDQGLGLPADEQQHVWDLYHRVPGVEVQGSAGGNEGSLGMGLYVCKRLIELHPGGKVGVKSVEGDGAIFWFSLPLASAVAETE